MPESDDSTRKIGRDYRTLVAFAFATCILTYMIAYPGVQNWVRGEPTELWLVDVVSGIVMIEAVVVVALDSWIDTNQSSSKRFNLSDWVTLAIFGNWIAFSTILYAIVGNNTNSIIVILLLLLGGCVGIAIHLREIS